MPRDRVLSGAEMLDVLRLLRAELGAVPVNPAQNYLGSGTADRAPGVASLSPLVPAQPWRTCASCDRRPVLTYTRAGRRYCPDCWDGPAGPVGPVATTDETRGDSA